jgi:hypothetical protein
MSMRRSFSKSLGFPLALENLEQRLPPGDTVLGIVAAVQMFDIGLSEASATDASREGPPRPFASPRARDATGLGSDWPAEPPIRQREAGAEPLTRPGETSAYVLVRPVPHSSMPNSGPRTRLSHSLFANSSSGIQVLASSLPNSGSGTPARETPFRGTTGAETEFFGGAFPNSSSATRVEDDRHGSLPFYFEQNLAQADTVFDFVARGPGYTLGLSATEAVFGIPAPSPLPFSRTGGERTQSAIARGPSHSPGGRGDGGEGEIVRMHLLGGNPTAPVTGLDPLVTKVNYFLGNDPNNWHTNVPTFAKVHYDDVYPGIDLVYYGSQHSVVSSQHENPNLPPSPPGRGAGGEGKTTPQHLPPSPLGRGDGGEGTTTHHSPLTNSPLTTHQLTTHQLEYDFIVAPGADPNQIQISFSGADSVTLDADGNLILRAGDAEIRQQKPYLYQEVNGTRQQVQGEFRVQNSEQNSESRIQNSESSRATDYCLLTTVYFSVGAYDTSRPLIIDPVVLGYSTYLGAGNEMDAAYDIAVDANGHAYVTGETRSLNFPASDGAFDETFNGSNNDAFVAKLNRNGSALLYATYLGGAGSDQAGGIAVDGDGNAYVTGGTWSKNFPTTPGAFDETFNGIIEGFMADAFVTKLSPDGSTLIYSTYLGGRNSDAGRRITMGSDRTAYLVGGTSSTNFPVTPGAFDTTYNGTGDTFVARLTSSGDTLVFATYLGGSDGAAAGGIAVDAAGNVFVTGSTQSSDFPTTPGAFQIEHSGSSDAYAVKLAADGSALAYSTFLGGGQGDGGDGIDVDGQGNVYIAGTTASLDFPVTPGAYDTTHLVIDGSDAFLTKLNQSGSALVYSTYMGAGSVGARGLAVDGHGHAYITGPVYAGMDTTLDAFDRTHNGSSDAYLMKLNQAGSALAYSTYLGGLNTEEGWSIAVDASGNAYIAGHTYSSDFPTTPSALKRRYRGDFADGFVTKFAKS